MRAVTLSARVRRAVLSNTAAEGRCEIPLPLTRHRQMTDSPSLEARIADLERRILALEHRDSVGPANAPIKRDELPVSDQSAPILVKLKTKSFHKADFLAGDAGDRIDFELLFGNNLPKAIRAFKGTLCFRDLFDEIVLSVDLKHEDSLRSGGTVTWRGGILFNQFEPGHQRLLNCDLDDLKASFTTQAVIFGDGTSQRFS
jgi:hypothetical protein